MIDQKQIQPVVDLSLKIEIALMETFEELLEKHEREVVASVMINIGSTLIGKAMFWMNVAGRDLMMEAIVQNIKEGIKDFEERFEKAKGAIEAAGAMDMTCYSDKPTKH